jgi:hypothetical protein
MLDYELIYRDLLRVAGRDNGLLSLSGTLSGGVKKVYFLT